MRETHVHLSFTKKEKKNTVYTLYRERPLTN